MSSKKENRGTIKGMQIIVIFGFQSYPFKTKSSQETARNLRKLFDLEENPKEKFTDDSMTFGKAGEDRQWNHCAQTPHRPKTNECRKSNKKSQKGHFICCTSVQTR